MADTDVTESAHSALLAFLCRAPIAVVQTSPSGDIEMLTPIAQQLLLPLAHDGRLDNLFALLERWSPGLRQQLQGLADTAGRVCDDLRIRLPAEPGGRSEQVLGLSMLRRDDGRLMVILNDVTVQDPCVARERFAERERMELASTAAGVGQFELDPASGAMAWNDQTFVLHGRPEAAGTGDVRAVREAALSATVRARVDAWARALPVGGDRAIEFEVAWPDGSVHWLSARCGPHQGAQSGFVPMLGVMCDVTDRVEAQRALRESEARCARAMRGSPDGFWEWDVRTGKVHLSPRWKELLGFGPDELSGHEASFFERLHPDDASLVSAALQAHLRHRSPYDVELRLRTRSGDYRWFRSRGEADRDAAGQPLRMAGSIFDITLRKSIEIELRDSHAMFSAVFRTVPVGIGLMRLDDGVTIEVNAEIARFLGWTQAEMVGRTGHELGLWSDDASRAAAMAQIARTGQATVEDLVMRHRNGQPVHAKLSVQQFELGGQQFLLSAITDLTERHQAEQALREQREAYAAVFNAASDAIISVDAQGRVLLFNPAAERIFGHRADALRGQPVDRLWPAPPCEPCRVDGAGLAEPHSSSGAIGARRVQGLHADGRALELEASISEATVGGQTGRTAILRDVTERAAAEAAARRHRFELSALTQQLMNQEKQTTQRLAQVLHDRLGQTLTAIRLSLDRSLLAVAPGAGADRREAFSQLRDLVDQAVNEVREALTDLRPPQLAEEGLYAALDNELAARKALHPGVDLLLEAPAGLHGQRWPADVEYALFMIARESIDNALRHARPNLVRLALDGSAESVMLEICDDGLGLPADAERARPGHLGLIGMRERVRAIGAQLSLSPSDEGGARVRASWPEAA